MKKAGARARTTTRGTTKRGTTRRRSRAQADTAGLRVGLQAALSPFFPSRPVYRDAGQGRRTDGFYAPEAGPAAAILSNGQMLRARSRACFRQNGWARKIRRAITAGVVGRGIKPTFRYEPATWGRTARELWDDWSEVADSAGLVDYYGFQAMVVDAMFEAGEVLVRRRPRLPEDDLPVPLQLQILESEHLPFWYNAALPSGGYIKAGIEFNAIGQRVGYWLYQHHPGEWATSFTMDTYALKRIPADQMAHIFVPERPESVRGCPHLARSLLRLWGLEEYDDAEMDRQRMNAMITAVIQLLDPEKGTDKLGPLHQDSLAARGGGPFTAIEPGTVPILGPGESLEALEPPEVGSNYDAFIRHNLRAASADGGVTYEQGTGDLSGTSYVSLRYGTIDARRWCEMLRGILRFQLDQRVLRWWMDAAVLAGALSAPGYETSTQRRAYQRVAWIPPAWERIQPDKEIPADVDACRAGFTTTDRIVAERTGEDGGVIAEERKAIQTRDDGLGLVSDADPRRPAGGKSPEAAAQKPGASSQDGRPSRPSAQQEMDAEDESAARPAPTGTDDE